MHVIEKTGLHSGRSACRSCQHCSHSHLDPHHGHTPAAETPFGQIPTTPMQTSVGQQQVQQVLHGRPQATESKRKRS